MILQQMKVDDAIIVSFRKMTSIVICSLDPQRQHSC